MHSTHSILRPRSIAGLLGLFSFALASTVCRGQELAIDTTLQATTSVNDNFLFQTQPHPTVLVLALSPSLALSRNTESTNLRIDANATTYVVPERHEDDHTNLHLALTYDLKGERDEFSVTTSFARDLTIEGELLSTGVLLATQRRVDAVLAPSWEHSFTERLQGTVQVSDDQARYSGLNGTSSVYDYHYYSLPISASYLVSEADSLNLLLNPSVYRADHVDDQIQSAQVELTWQHQFTEGSRFSAGAGGFASRTHVGQTLTICPLALEFCQLGFIPFVTLESSQSFRQTGSILDARLDLQVDELNAVAVHGSRNLSPSGAGTLLLVQAWDGELTHSFSEVLKGQVGYSRAQSQFIGLTTNNPRNGYESLQVNVTLKLDPFANLEIGARHSDTFSEQRLAGIRANEIYASYRYVWPQSTAAQSQ